MGAGFCVGEGVVVVFEDVAAGGGDGVELVVGEAAAEVASGGGEGVVELVVGVVHLVDSEDGFEAAFVETAVVGDEREAFDLVLNLLPDYGEDRGVFGVFFGEAVDLLAEPLVVFGLGVDEAVEGVYDLSVTDDDDAY